MEKIFLENYIPTYGPGSITEILKTPESIEMKATIKNNIPAPAWNVIRRAYSNLMHLPDLPGAYLHPWRRASIRRLAALKDTHTGQRAFIIGNGPSLKQTDLGKLKGEFTFGLNRIYLMFPELGFTTTCLVSINDLVIEQCAAEIAALPMPKFLSWRSHRVFETCPPAARPTFLYTTYDNPGFARDARFRVWEGATVTNVALQLAFHMGFAQVILIGVDHNFMATGGKPNTTVTSDGNDPNHFSGQYFGKGFRWQLPDLETSEIGYRLARQAYEQAGRQVLDATVGGKLTIFPKADYNSLF
ncbi:MAG: 6-hydroxymethylpterin diphosphokinase MptE-like protein [Anaerolineales bacterium]